MDPKAFIDIAQSLIDETAPSEAAIRTSIGRSYFGLFNLLASFIKKSGFDLPKAAEAHKIVHRDLYECKVDAARCVAQLLDSLRDDRNIADYNLEFSGYKDSRNAELSLRRARKAYDDFEGLTASLKKRNHLKKRITAYRRSTNSGSGSCQARGN